MNQSNENEIFLEPPLFFAQDHIFDINFHNSSDVLACSLISGHVKLLSYNRDEVKEIASFDHHKESARVSLFSQTGQQLLTASKDGSFALLDQNGKLISHKLGAHNAKFLNEHLVSIGDDSGRIKIWDLRSIECVYSVKEVDEAITAFDIDTTMNSLVSSSLDGYLSVFDLRVSSNSKSALLARSDCMEEDLTGVCLIKNGKFVCVSTSEGNLLLFKWDYFGDFKDRVIGHPNSIDTLLKIDEQTIMTGGEDGLVRGVGIFPNSILSILGQHEEDQQFPITKLDIDRTKRIVASISHDNSIKFHDVVDFIQKRMNTKAFDPPELIEKAQKQQKEASDEDSEEMESEEEDSDSSDESNNNMKQKNSNQFKTKNIKQSKKQIKRKQLQNFYHDL